MEDQSEYLYDSEENELLGQLIMPDFELKSDVLEEMETEVSQSDEELTEAIHAIEETESHESPETTALSADDVHVSVPAMEIQQEVTSRFAKLDDDALEKIICETESTSTKRYSSVGVNSKKSRIVQCMICTALSQIPYPISFSFYIANTFLFSLSKITHI